MRFQILFLALSIQLSSAASPIAVSSNILSNQSCPQNIDRYPHNKRIFPALSQEIISPANLVLETTDPKLKPETIVLTLTTIIELVVGTEQQHHESEMQSMRKELQHNARVGGGDIQLVGKPVADIKRKTVVKTADLGFGFTGFPNS